MRVLALVGLGPRGAGLLERLISNAAALDAGALEIHLVDPYPPGGGRVWRPAQSPLLLLNSTAEDVTAFLDDSVACAGPVMPGPTLHAWASGVGPGDLDDPGLEAEAATLGPLDFASRRLAGAYFGWAHEQVVRRAPAEVNLVTHAQRAVDLQGDPDGQQRLVLEDGTVVAADAVVLVSSHVDVEAGEPHRSLARFAAGHGLAYLPPGYGGDVDLDLLRPGQDTIVRGFGLGFVDLLVLLTEGRGGAYEETPDGLRYLPSGREPVLHVGSRRGVPYHCKPMYHLRAPQPATTRFLTPESLAQLLAEHEVLEFGRDVWPLVAKEVCWAALVELALGHPGRTTVGLAELEAGYAPLTWGTPELDAFLAGVVPDPADRLDLAGMDRPLATAATGDPQAWSQAVRDYVRADLARRQDDRFSADLGAFHGFLAVLPVLAPLLTSPQLTPASVTAEFHGWWMGLFSFYASGPPPERLEQLLALERAGIVSFLGPDLVVSTDEHRGLFVARTPARTEPLLAAQLVDATLPALSLARVDDPLLRALVRRGAVRSKVLTGTDGTAVDTELLEVDARQRVVDATGSASGRRFSIGMHTSVRPAAFARPGSNGPVHRLNDQLARTLLQLPEPARPRSAGEHPDEEPATADPVAAAGAKA